jgi:hypothetical protein
MTIKQNGGIFGRKPTFNGVTDEGTTRLESLGVNIGTDTPTTFAEIRSNGVSGEETILQLTRPTYGECMTFGRAAGDGLIKSNRNIIMRADADNNSVGSDSNIIFQYDGSNEAARFNSDGNLAFPSGQGIDFSATSGTGTSELFDDYEEGTWTPTYAPSTGSFTSITYGNTGGVYTKIGNICIVSGYISTSALDTTGGSGAIKVGGLPYSIAGSSGGTRDAWRGGSIGYSASWSGERPSSVFAAGGASDFRIMYRSNATSDSAYVLVADMDTSGSNEIAFTLTYRV